MRILCRTNIDDCRKLEWPEALPGYPHVGDLIKSPTKMMHDIEVELEVCRITWVLGHQGWMPVVELGMIKGRFHNMKHFLDILEYANGRIEKETLQRRTQDNLDSMSK